MRHTSDAGWHEEEVSLATIDVSEWNTRKDLGAGEEDASLGDLARSIREHGLLQLPILRPTPSGRFEVVAGQRRILACRTLGMSTVHARVSNLPDDDALAVSLIENVQRADMHWRDKARAYNELLARYGSISHVSRETGVSETTVRRYIALSGLAQSVQSVAGTSEGAAGVGFLSTLARVFPDPEEQSEAFEQLRGFTSEVSERILHESGGDLQELLALKENALEDTLGVEICGNSVETCPYVPPSLRLRIVQMITENGQEGYRRARNAHPSVPKHPTTGIQLEFDGVSPSS